MTRFEFYGNLNKYHDGNSLSHKQSPLYGKQNPNAKYYRREGQPGNYRYYYTKEEYDAAHRQGNAQTDAQNSMAGYNDWKKQQAQKKVAEDRNNMSGYNDYKKQQEENIRKNREEISKKNDAGREADIKKSQKIEQDRLAKEEQLEKDLTSIKTLNHETEVLNDEKKNKREALYNKQRDFANEIQEGASEWMKKNGRAYYWEFVDEFNKAANDYSFDAKLFPDGDWSIISNSSDFDEIDKCYSDIQKYQTHINDCINKLHNNSSKYDIASLEEQKALYERNIAKLEGQIHDLWSKNTDESRKIFNEILDHMNNDILYEKKLYENVITEDKK